MNNLNGFYFGFLFDWDIDSMFLDSSAYNDSCKLAYVFKNSTYAGTSVLNDTDVSCNIYDNFDSDFIDGFSDEEKWQAISGGVQNTQLLNKDIAYVIAAGPFDIAVNNSIEVGVALLAGEGESDIINNAKA